MTHASKLQSKFLLMTLFLFATTGLSLAQQNFNINVYQSSGPTGPVIGNLAGNLATSGGTCGGNSSFTVQTYTFYVASFNAGPIAGGYARLSGQASLVTFNGGNNNPSQCPTAGWSVHLPYNMAFTSGDVCQGPPGGNPNAWQGDSIDFAGSYAILKGTSHC